MSVPATYVAGLTLAWQVYRRDSGDQAMTFANFCKAEIINRTKSLGDDANRLQPQQPEHLELVNRRQQGRLTLVAQRRTVQGKTHTLILVLAFS